MKYIFLDIAEIVDAWRIFPRLYLFGYGALCWHLADWVMKKPDISATQATFATAIIGLAVPLTGWYMQTGRRWQ